MNLVNISRIRNLSLTFFLNDYFVRYFIRSWQIFSFRTWNTSFHLFLNCSISVEKSAIGLMMASLYMNSSFLQLKKEEKLPNIFILPHFQKELEICG